MFEVKRAYIRSAQGDTRVYVWMKCKYSGILIDFAHVVLRNKSNVNHIRCSNVYLISVNL